MRALALVATLVATPLFADCDAEVRAFYEQGGLFDPAELTPQEHRAIMVAPDGTETPYNVSRWETAARSISDNNGMFLLSYDGRFYQGEGWDGPWTDMGYPEQGDAIDLGRAMNETTLANLANVTCHGTVDLDGTTARKFSYRYRVETAGGASWWESDYVLFVDATTGARLRTEEHGLLESWSQTGEPLKDTRVTTVRHMPGYTIPNPPPAN